ncbi:MAG: hypothetical protein ABI068_08780 [Ktedonobacterales bacterium]
MRIERPEGTVVARGVAVQIEEEGGQERLNEDEARPYDLCWLYTAQGMPVVPLQRRDVVFDEVNLDPETRQLAKYRVVGPVETFAGDHQEALCERVVGG